VLLKFENGRLVEVALAGGRGGFAGREGTLRGGKADV
jgi:hypothetical protein